MRAQVIWRFSDGKAGHDAQSYGLIAALAGLQAFTVVDVAPLPRLRALQSLCSRRCMDWDGLPKPTLAIGAGHATHLSLLAARRIHRCKAVVLMRPSLPLAWFDLCLIPEHDAPPARRNVLLTRGALNRLQPSSTLQPSHGLFLIGGPSAHYAWDHQALHRQIAAIVAATPMLRWTLSTSRRTPPEFLHGAAPLPEQICAVAFAETDRHWLPAQLAIAGQVWVTADSVSMIYEALTAGAAVGVLDVPSLRPNRVQRGVEQLIAQGWVTPCAAWATTHSLARPAQTFNEAQRCAAWMVQQWLA